MGLFSCWFVCTYSEQRPPVYNAEDYSLYLRKYCKFTGEYKEKFAQFPFHISTRKMYIEHSGGIL
jgi:hypothetical protein